MQELLNQLKIKADVVDVVESESVSKYYLRLQPGGKVAKIERCADEIALGLRSYSVPLVKLIPEKGLVEVELLTAPPKKVAFDNLMKDLNNHKGQLPSILGTTHAGQNLIFDITQAPHLLVSGTTGSGKTVMLHSIICSLLNTSNLKLALIDPKNVEFSSYQNLKQLAYPVVNYAEEAYDLLADLVEVMDERFKLMAAASVNDIVSYNLKKKKQFPYVVLVIDEFADLMMISKKEFQTKLSRLAQKSRACGIHIIISTQRPSSDIVTGVIKANFPARISCKVTSAVNSRVIFDAKGAEKLIGKGDAIIKAGEYNMVRFQGAFLGPAQINDICHLNRKSRASKVWSFLRGAR